MRCSLATLGMLFAALAHGADDTPKANGILDGKKVSFPEKAIGEGVKATVGLLESCHNESLFQPDELKKTLQGDHVRFVLTKAITSEVMNEKIEFSELVFRLPLNTGIFWVRNGDKWRQYSKYEIQKEKPFEVWLREARRRSNFPVRQSKTAPIMRSVTRRLTQAELLVSIALLIHAGPTTAPAGSLDLLFINLGDSPCADC